MKLISGSINDTVKIGKAISGLLGKGNIVCLFGQLGSGKTVLAKGIACGLGIRAKDIISPTFVIIRQYCQAKFPMYHFDLYRLNNEEEILSLGYEEYFYGEGVSVIEWADKLKGLLPQEYLRVDLKVKGQNKRAIDIMPYGQRYKVLLGKLKSKLEDL